MKLIETAISGVRIVEPKTLRHARGFFMEVYQEHRYAGSGIVPRFVQDNLSRSVRGALRGLHLQNPRPQGKLVTVLRGCVLDIAVDVRIGSPSFGRHVAIELSEENRLQVWIPRGFAHGFIVRSGISDIFYKCDDYYSPADEIVLRWNDRQLGIDWGNGHPQVLARDREGNTLAQLGGRLPRYEPA
jgi:dTDP-4-dehydrorhamnose 3,5-epimerase